MFSILEIFELHPLYSLWVSDITAHAEVVTDDEETRYHAGTIGTYHPETKKKKGLLRFFGR